MAKSSTFSLGDLRGGINNSDSPTLLPDNQIVDARNVDFRDGAIGAKRRGTLGIGISGATFNSPVVALIHHTPTNIAGNDELWGIDENGNLDRRVGGSWAGGVARVNNNVTINSRNYDANGVSLHGKLFLAAQGAQDRLLVWDGTVLRWAGLAQPPDPTVANTAVAGTYASTRYFRIRYTAQSGGVTIRRSEPTNVVSLVPSGTFTGAVITKPAGTEAAASVYCEGQTHWEVEASIDNILFYRIATVVIGTSTYTDTTAYATGYSSNTLSETIGEYIPPRSVRHVAVDEDRVIGAGSYFTAAYDSTVVWTPVAADDGVGNDERIPTATSQFISFDGLDGGAVMCVVAGVAGNVYVFKRSRVYKMIRTGIVTAAYDPVTESFSRGSTSRGATSGTDQNGVPCAYFLDPSVGLCRIGQRGVEDLGRPVRKTWRARNPAPAINPRIIYYPGLDQVWYTSPTGAGSEIQTSNASIIVTADGSSILTSQTAPNLLIEYEVLYNGSMFHDGVPGSAQAMSTFPRASDNALAPVLGTQLTSIGGGNSSYLHEADTGATDSGALYRGYVTTKPYTIGALWQKFGLMSATLLARAASGTSFWIDMIRNFGVEERAITVDLTPVLTEDHVVRPIDNATLSDLHTVQLSYGDVAASAQVWSADQIVCEVRSEGSL